MTMRGYSLGIDIGGTFTDIVLFEHDRGGQLSRKVLTTHDDPARGVVIGVRALLELHAIDPSRIQRVVHATTLFTNALIERKGAKTGLITTAGFRDVLEIGRERKYDLYDIGITNPTPLVPRNLRREVSERMTADGTVRESLNTGELEHEIESLVAEGVTSIAIVFLHAYANPKHERKAAEIIAQRAPGVLVTTSSDVAPEIREYDRTSTTVANAYVKPLAAAYLQAMAEQLRALDIQAPLLLMLSNGGLTHVEEAKRVPVQMLESGPAAGALAASFFGGADGVRDLLAFDMGGTTAKLSLIDGGEPLIAYGFEAARQKRFIEGSGLPIRISTVELIEIGAGGGSIARRDEIGLLKVGPDSAGSQPGPAAYGLGGDVPTVTDANFVLSYISPDSFAGGAVPIDMDAARQALGGLAKMVDLPVDDTSWGIHDVVNENMAAAARVHIAERGRDPRNYTLLCTGGGGPVHGYQVARKLGLKRLICPPSAGVASALGLIIAPARIDRVATVGIRLDRGDLCALEQAFRDLEADARAMVAETGVAVDAAVVERLADGRFIGQGFNLVVPLPPGPYDQGDDGTARAVLKDAFERSYREKFARTPPDVPIEFINVRVSVRVPIEDTRLSHLAEGANATALRGRRPIFFPEAGGKIDAAVYWRDDLSPGVVLEGPAVIEEDGSTLLVGPGARIEVAPTRNIIVTLP
jgi:N-methylhydantoinase A